MVLVQDDAEIKSARSKRLVRRRRRARRARAVGGIVTWPGGERVPTAGLRPLERLLALRGRRRLARRWLAAGATVRGRLLLVELAARPAETWDAVGGLDDSSFRRATSTPTSRCRIRRADRAVLVEPRARSTTGAGRAAPSPSSASSPCATPSCFASAGAELARTRSRRGSAAPRSSSGPWGERRTPFAVCAAAATAPTGEPPAARDIDP